MSWSFICNWNCVGKIFTAFQNSLKQRLLRLGSFESCHFIIKRYVHGSRSKFRLSFISKTFYSDTFLNVTNCIENICLTHFCSNSSLLWNFLQNVFGVAFGLNTFWLLSCLLPCLFLKHYENYLTVIIFFQKICKSFLLPFIVVTKIL